MTMAANHLGHFLLTHLLSERLARAGGRVINVSSDGHRGGELKRAPLEEIMTGRVSFNGLKAYADSKLANVLFAFELSRRMSSAGLAATAVHPGVLSTRIWNQNRDPLSLLMRMMTPTQAADVRDGWALQSPLRQQAVSAPTKLVCCRPLLHMHRVPSTPQVSRADQDPGVFAAGPPALL